MADRMFGGRHNPHASSGTICPTRTSSALGRPPYQRSSAGVKLMSRSRIVSIVVPLGSVASGPFSAKRTISSGSEMFRLMAMLQTRRTDDRSRLGGGAWLDFFEKGRFELVARYFQVVMGLHVHPELGRVAKVTAEAQCGLRGNAARAVDNRGDAIWGDVKRFRKLVHREAKIGHEFFFQVFSRMNWGQFLGHGFSSVIVYDVEIVDY